MAVRADLGPWVIVAGGFHQRGGMDRANAALADYLLRGGADVHLVAHEIDAALLARERVTAHLVTRPRGLPALAERLLARTGRHVATAVTRARPGARVVVNGGNCPWPDVNWVHAVHAAWPVNDAGAPAWSRWRNRRLKTWAQARERDALRQAQVVIANSESTRRAIVDQLGVDGRRVRTVYLGSEPSWGRADQGERSSARRALGLPGDAPIVAFAGALGSDVNKGFDVLSEAWKLLAPGSAWDAHLVVAGDGWRLPRWRDDWARAGLAPRVHFLGFTERMREVLAAADLLVSPVRYEAYGLNVHEALCRGAAVMVTRTAGVTERFDSAMSEALLPERPTPGALADRLRLWREDVEGWRRRAAPTAARLRGRTWDDMAADLVEQVHPVARGIVA